MTSLDQPPNEECAGEQPAQQMFRALLSTFRLRQRKSSRRGFALELTCRYRRGFLAGRTPLLYRRLSVALLQSRDRDGKYKFLFTVIVELDDNVLFGAGKHGAQTILGVLNLRALRERGFASHKGGLMMRLGASFYMLTFWQPFVEDAFHA